MLLTFESVGLALARLSVVQQRESYPLVSSCAVESAWETAKGKDSDWSVFDWLMMRGGSRAIIYLVIPQVMKSQECCFQRFEILKAHGVKGRRPLENQGIWSISSAKMNQKLS